MVPRECWMVPRECWPLWSVGPYGGDGRTQRSSLKVVLACGCFSALSRQPTIVAPDIVTAFIVMAFIVMACVVVAFIVMAYIVMACTVMANTVMVHILMAYIVMACRYVPASSWQPMISDPKKGQDMTVYAITNMP